MQQYTKSAMNTCLGFEKLGEEARTAGARSNNRSENRTRYKKATHSDSPEALDVTAMDTRLAIGERRSAREISLDIMDDLLYSRLAQHGENW